MKKGIILYMDFYLRFYNDFVKILIYPMQQKLSTQISNISVNFKDYIGRLPTFVV